MKKEGKKSDLEGLLNSLIEKGWKPFGEYDKLMTYGQNKGRKVFGFGVLGEVEYSLRELVSKESGLWQFVCENGMIDNLCEARYWRNHFELDEIEYNQPDYQYRVIESSLKDESELEDFLLQNIKVN